MDIIDGHVFVYFYCSQVQDAWWNNIFSLDCCIWAISPNFFCYMLKGKCQWHCFWHTLFQHILYYFWISYVSLKMEWDPHDSEVPTWISLNNRSLLTNAFPLLSMENVREDTFKLALKGNWWTSTSWSLTFFLLFLLVCPNLC